MKMQEIPPPPSPFNKVKGQIKSICRKCGHIETYTWKELVLEFMNHILRLFGLIFIILLIAVGPTYIMNMLAESTFLMYTNYHNDELRAVALNYTTYDGEDSFEWAIDIATNMPRIRYVPCSKFEVFNEGNATLRGGGDCKNSAAFYSSMLLTVGIDSTLDCDVEANHCLTRIDAPGKTQYLVIDLTNDTWRLFNKSINHWKNPYAFEEFGRL